MSEKKTFNRPERLPDETPAEPQSAPHVPDVTVESTPGTPVAPPEHHGLFGSLKAKATKVRSLVHMDDTSDTGKSYRPGDIIKGWDQEKIDRIAASGQVEIVDA